MELFSGALNLLTFGFLLILYPITFLISAHIVCLLGLYFTAACLYIVNYDDNFVKSSIKRMVGIGVMHGILICFMSVHAEITASFYLSWKMFILSVLFSTVAMVAVGLATVIGAIIASRAIFFDTRIVLSSDEEGF